MKVFGWTVRQWAAAFALYPVEGKMTLGKAADVRRQWSQRGFCSEPGVSLIELPHDVRPAEDWDAAVKLFELPMELVYD